MYVYCIICHKAWPLQSQQQRNDIHHEAEAQCDQQDQGQRSCQQMHDGTPVEFPGVFISPDFISDEEEHSIVAAIDESPWKPSQSGRFKQVSNTDNTCNRETISGAIKESSKKSCSQNLQI